MQSRGCRAATRASVCDHGWFCRGGGLDFFGCSFRSDAPRSRLPFSRGEERSGDARRRPTGCLEERPSFDPRSKSAATIADDGLVPAQLAQRCCSALRRRRKIAVEAIAALRRANYGPPAFRRPLGPCGGLGRSQAVRQRILIPPSGGSNPPAPAAQFPGDRQGCGQQRGHRRAIGRRTAWRLRIPLCPQCARSCHSLAGPPRASD
jgi:hypothetical protein